MPWADLRPNGHLQEWIERVNWSARRAVLRVTRRAVATSPVFERRVPLSEDGLVQVQRHFEKSE